MKNASNGQVTFPFVVLATHRDKFLSCSCAGKPHEELKVAVSQTYPRGSKYPIIRYLGFGI